MKAQLISTVTFLAMISASIAADPSPSATPKSLTSELMDSAKATQLKAAEMIAESRKRQTDIFKKSSDISDKSEALLKRQEEQLDRFDKILSVWEKQQKQYQIYLDSLSKNKTEQGAAANP